MNYKESNRTGHYVCALALVYPDGREVTAEGYCDGLVQDEPKGENMALAMIRTSAISMCLSLKGDGRAKYRREGND